MSTRQEEKVVVWLVVGLVFAVMSIGISRAAEKGLVGYWNFDEEKGTTVKDSSGSGANGTIEGAKWVKGKVGNALEFDGVENYVEVEDNEKLNPSSAISIEFWIKPTASQDVDEQNNWRYVISKGGWGSYHIILEEKLTFGVTVKADGADQRWWNKTPIAIGEWSHCAFTFDASTGMGRTYVNGKLDTEQEKTKGTIDVNDGTLKIGWPSGTDAPNGSGCPKAVIDEVKIYNRVLSADEVKAHCGSPGK